MSEFEYVPQHPEGLPGNLIAMLGDAGMKDYLQSQALGREAHALIAHSKSNLIDARAGVYKTVSCTLALFSMPVTYWLWRWAVGG